MQHVEITKQWPYSPHGYDNAVGEVGDKLNLDDDLAKACVDGGFGVLCEAPGPSEDADPKAQAEGGKQDEKQKAQTGNKDKGAPKDAENK